jgi:hypothetical protein
VSGRAEAHLNKTGAHAPSLPPLPPTQWWKRRAASVGVTAFVRHGLIGPQREAQNTLVTLPSAVAADRRITYWLVCFRERGGRDDGRSGSDKRGAANTGRLAEPARLSGIPTEVMLS